MSNSVAIVTGASQGIGQATAIRLARDFSAIVLVARNRANLEQTSEAVGAAGAEALVIDADLAEPQAVNAIVNQTMAAFGRIDALLNIAGAVPQIDLFDMTDAQWEGGLALKLHGARRLTIAAWPALKAAKGAVVLMSGNSALFRRRRTRLSERSMRQLSPWQRRSPIAASPMACRSTVFYPVQ
ncbi:SDR family NAD(P)-dependent oxidoreductase [Mesorhizobium caraganae]